MNKIWIVILVSTIFLIINLIYYKSTKGFVKETLGKKWLAIWGNKVYFWQSSIFVSIAGTTLILYILKFLTILSF